jgi:putative ABC transport system permease protein
MNDVRFALRQHFNHSGFFAAAVLMLALGIGAATSLFSAVYGVLIDPYPYAKPGEIWTPGLRSATANQRMRPYPPKEYLEMAKLSAFSDVMATGPGNVLLTGEFAPETIRGVRLSGNAFNFLGVPPLIGRTIQPSDIRATGEPELVTVLSFRRWQRLFGGDPNAVGKTLRLDDQPYTVIGVMPPRFGWWTDDGVWLPMGTDSRDQQGVFPIVRLASGTSSFVAEQRLHVLHREFAKANPTGYPRDEFATTLTNYLDITVASGEMRQSLQLLLGAVGLLLLIACANVANLQLARGTSRTREMAIRLAVGAGRGRLVRQLLTESVLVSLIGGLLGLLFAASMTRLVVALMPSFNVPNEARIEINLYVLMFCVIISACTGILFGLIPALQSSRPDLVEALKDDARSGSASAGKRTRALLVVAEVAFSVVLLVSAGLTIRSFIALEQVDLGFEPRRVMVVGLPLPPKRYSTWDQRNRFAQNLLDRVKHVPGVQAATIGNGGLPFGGPESTFAIDGQPQPGSHPIMLHLAGADYLRTLGIPLLRGRMFTEEEVDRARPVAVINEAAARLWPAGEDPLGRVLKLDELKNPGGLNLTSTDASADVTLVGVMGNARNDDVRSDPQPAVLVPYTLVAPPHRVLAVRTMADEDAFGNALRAQVREMDREQPVNGPITMEAILGFRTAQPRFLVALFSVFAALGLALALAGLYSVLSYLVSRRTREIGVRMALGAQRADVLRLIMQTGGSFVGAGIVVGTLASIGVARLLASQLELFRVTATDPVSFSVVIVLLSVVAVAACYIPARRATRVDPIEALRYE